MIFGTRLLYVKLAPPPSTRLVLTVLHSGAVMTDEVRCLRDQLNQLLREIDTRRGP
jgi:hypothetical protein